LYAVWLPADCSAAETLTLLLAGMCKADVFAAVTARLDV
jgi:hypothetical protein